MFFLNLQIKDKLLFILIAIYLFFLAYSEALKNITVYLLLIYFLLQLLIGRVALTKDIINISIISHLFVVIIGIWIGINSKESLNQFMDITHITLIFLFFREMNLKFLTYEKILQLLFLGFSFAILLGMYILFIHGGDGTSWTRLELHSVGSVNRTSVYIVYIFVTSLCFVNNYRAGLNRYLIPFVFYLSLISVVIASSRMAVFSLPFIIMLYYIFSKRISLKNTLLLILASSIFIYTLFSFIDFPSEIETSMKILDYFVYKVSNGFDDPIRMQIWSSVIYAWTENNLWFGIGVGNSIFIDVATYFPGGALTNYIDNAHNVYLDMLLERGIFGLVTFMSFMVSLLFIQNDSKLMPSFFLKILVFSLLIMGLANITFRYEFALLFVTLVGAFLNPSIRK